MGNLSPGGISQEALDLLEKEFFCKPLKDVPSPTPPISQEVLDAIPRKHLGLQYATQHEHQELDLYLPPEAESNHVPLLVYVHGGGFAWGDKRDLTDTPYFSVLNHGYALASVNYRLSSVAPFPAALCDVKAAIRWLRAHASEYSIDPARIAIAGVSAGGWISLMVATTPNIAELEDLSQGNAAYGTEVRCAIAAFAATDYARMEDQYKENGMELDSETIETTNQFIGRDIAKMSFEELRRVSPIAYITPQIPPLMLQAGIDDHFVPYQQTKTFAERVEEIAGKERVEWKLVPGADHSDPAFKMPPWQAQVVAFMDKYMK